MDFLGPAAVMLAAGVLVALSPRESWGRAVKAAGVFLAVTILLSLLLPPVLAAVLGERDALGAYVPSGAGAVADAVGLVVRRGGVAVVIGLLVARLASGELPRALVMALAGFLAAALEVALQVEAIRSLAAVFPPVVIANLLAPEVTPPLFGGLAAGYVATHDASR
jgi:hypothetical protein